jgi:AcrR family transcriptional regulator
LHTSTNVSPVAEESSDRRQTTRLKEPRTESPTAQRILEAAKRILTERGYQHFTLKEIEEESGEFRALVAYYFGNKRGLVQAVVDSLMDDEDADLRAELEAIADPSERVARLLDAQHEISADWRGFRAFYELLPHIMQDELMRARLAESYRSSRELDRRCLESASEGMDGAVLDRLAALSVAVVEGLAVQYAADRERFDHDGTFRLWRSMMVDRLKRPPTE